MRVISKSILRSFWENPRNPKDAQRYLSAWYKIARAAEWRNFAELRNTFGSADSVGDCVVFDVGNNRSRVIGRLRYGPGVLYVLEVMTHAEYDERDWPEDCGCHEPPPQSRPTKGPRKKK